MFICLRGDLRTTCDDCVNDGGTGNGSGGDEEAAGATLIGGMFTTYTCGGGASRPTCSAATARLMLTLAGETNASDGTVDGTASIIRTPDVVDVDDAERMSDVVDVEDDAERVAGDGDAEGIRCSSSISTMRFCVLHSSFCCSATCCMVVSNR